MSIYDAEGRLDEFALAQKLSCDLQQEGVLPWAMSPSGITVTYLKGGTVCTIAASSQPPFCVVIRTEDGVERMRGRYSKILECVRELIAEHEAKKPDPEPEPERTPDPSDVALTPRMLINLWRRYMCSTAKAATWPGFTVWLADHGAEEGRDG